LKNIRETSRVSGRVGSLKRRTGTKEEEEEVSERCWGGLRGQLHLSFLSLTPLHKLTFEVCRLLL